MNKQLWIDGQAISFTTGQTLMDAATAAQVYIPHLCHNPELSPYGSCRLCIVKVNHRYVTACTTPAQADTRVDNNTRELNEQRKLLLQMLFVEGNHQCPACEKSDACQLQAVAYYCGMLAPALHHFYPIRSVDASHSQVMIDYNRCILCALCVRASDQLDNKQVFSIRGRRLDTHLQVNTASGKLTDSAFSVHDKAAHICPTGAILPKYQGYEIPIGKRFYDQLAGNLAADISSRGTMKTSIATASLCGCFGCHMSLLDIDERLPTLLDAVNLRRSPLTDNKAIEPVDVVLIEGGVCNQENVEILQAFRHNSKVLVAIGACALNGGIPAMRNHYSVQDCLTESYVDGSGLEQPHIPDDPEIPRLLEKVLPLHEVVQVDYFLPGCPPSAEAIWQFLQSLLKGDSINLPRELIHYD